MELPFFISQLAKHPGAMRLNTKSPYCRPFYPRPVKVTMADYEQTHTCRLP